MNSKEFFIHTVCAFFKSIWYMPSNQSLTFELGVLSQTGRQMALSYICKMKTKLCEFFEYFHHNFFEWLSNISILRIYFCR